MSAAEAIEAILAAGPDAVIWIRSRGGIQVGCRIEGDRLVDAFYGDPIRVAPGDEVTLPDGRRIQVPRGGSR